MNNEYYGAASTPTDDFLAHYGIKGMKWGVRRAIVKGGEKALRRQYIKAQKKLEKLDKQAAKSATYKKRAIRMGIGAGVAGGLAAAGTSGVSSAMRATGRLAGKGMKGLGNAMEAAGRGLIDSRKNGVIGDALRRGGHAVSSASGKVSGAMGGASHAVDEWGRSTSVTKGIGSGIIHDSGVSNNTIARVGAGVIGAGLAAGAARNAYKAKTAQKKAQQFRTEMNKAFAGTKYANRTDRPASNQKKRKNRG